MSKWVCCGTIKAEKAKLRGICRDSDNFLTLSILDISLKAEAKVDGTKTKTRQRDQRINVLCRPCRLI